MSTELMSQFLEGLHASRLLDTERIEEVLRRPESPQGDVDGIAKFLETSGWLTGFQISEIRQGRGGTLMFAAYRLLERLPDQPSGPVFQAYHPALQQAVLVRWLTDTWIGPADTMRGFIEQAQAASLLNHPNVVGTLDAGWIGETPFVVQECIDGADLEQLVNEMGALPVPLACEYARQAALALQSAHERRLFHGDLSPQRLILAPIIRKPGVNGSGQTVSLRPAPGAGIKVAEIGLNPRRPPIGELSFMQADLLGAVDFLAPERLSEAAQCAKGDLYSLGASIYFMLAARPPYPAASAADALAQLQKAEPDRIDVLRNDVPPALAGFIHDLLSKDPAKRPVDAAEVARFLQGYAKMSSPAPTTPVAIPLANATTSVPNALPGIMTKIADSRLGDRVPLEQPLVEALPEGTSDSQVFGPHKAPASAQIAEDHEHHDMFGHHSDDFRPRPKRQPEVKGGWTWMILGGCLHLLAVTLLLFYFKIWPFNEPSPTVEETPPVKEKEKEKDKKPPEKGKTKRKLAEQLERKLGSSSPIHDAGQFS